MSLQSPEVFAQKATQIIELAKKYGADEVGVSLSQSEGISVQTREGKIEELNREQELSIHIGVYKNQATGSSALSDWSDTALEAGVQAAINAATFTEPDSHFGLPAPEQYAQPTAQDIADLALDSGELPNAVWLEAQAHAMEVAAFAADKRIAMSDGASAQSGRNYHYYANSNGFAAGTHRSRVDLSISVLAREKDNQQSHYAYDSARWQEDLQSAEAIGIKAAERTVAMLNPREVQTGSYPVLFVPEMARGLFRHLTGALSGTSQYRKLSFLVDSLGQQILPAWLNLEEMPHIPRGLYSSLYDSDGLPACQGALIEAGRVAHYVLNVYAARRLGLSPTGNAGGIRNLMVKAQDGHVLSRSDLYREMGNGVVVTSLMGQGVNSLTGDYSRGASGFWVENGELAYPIDGITIAGNLKEMYQQIVAIGDDPDPLGSIRAPAVLIEKMTVAR